jgi:hypothetical protein
VFEVRANRCSNNTDHSLKVMHQLNQELTMKKHIIILIAFIASWASFAKAQDQLSKRNSIVKAFVSAVFKEHKNTRFIMDNYMYIASDTISPVKKEVLVTHMIDTLLKANSHAIASSNYEIFKYNNFKGDKRKFNTEDSSDILILAINNKAAIYFYFNQERISSFLVINKGSLSFFVTI